MKEFNIDSNNSNQTILNFIKKTYNETPLSVIYKWFRTKKIKINGKHCKDTKLKLNEHDHVIIYSNDFIPDNIKKITEHEKLNIFYEDENILIVFKRHGRNVHDISNSSLDGDVINYLGFSSDGTFKISHAHRLDKPTAGLIIYPKNKQSSLEIYKYIDNKDVIKKTYMCQLEKSLDYTGAQKGYILYDEKNKRSVFTEDKISNLQKECAQIVTVYNKEKNIYSVDLVTGRKHQIRAINSYYKSPIINDYRYGAKKVYNETKINLVAYKINFNFPKESILNYLNSKDICCDSENLFK